MLRFYIIYAKNLLTSSFFELNIETYIIKKKCQTLFYFNFASNVFFTRSGTNWGTVRHWSLKISILGLVLISCLCN